jgi:hypothetical protein
MPAATYKSDIQNSKTNSKDKFSATQKEILNLVCFSAEGLFKKAGLQTAKLQNIGVPKIPT